MLARGEVADGEEALREVLEHERVPRVQGEAHLQRVARDVGLAATHSQGSEAAPQRGVRAVDLDRRGVAPKGEGVRFGFGRGRGRVGGGVALVRELGDEAAEGLERQELDLGHRGREGDATRDGRRRPTQVRRGFRHHGVLQNRPELAHRRLALAGANVEERGLVLGRQARLLRLARDRLRAPGGVPVAMGGVVQRRPLHGEEARARGGGCKRGRGRTRRSERPRVAPRGGERVRAPREVPRERPAHQLI